MEWMRYGPVAVWVRFATHPDEVAFARAQAWVTLLEREPPAGLTEFVPAFTTLLLLFVDTAHRDRAFEELPEAWERARATLANHAPDKEAPARPAIEIPVNYGGPDLARVAEHAQLPIEEVVERHQSPLYRVHCLGFAPGFPYLGGLDPRLHTPRLKAPRPRVPIGSVAIGGEHTGVYSIASPGGWNLIGSTAVALFRPDRQSLRHMFHLQVGDRVRFSQTADLTLEPESSPAREVASASEAGAVLRVVSVGLGMSIQDHGRPGFGRFGVPPSGAMDPASAASANRLLDNPLNAPVLELCLQGQRLEVLRTGWLAVAGSGGGFKGEPPAWATFRVQVGDLLNFPPSGSGIWTYLAVPGGWVAPQFLGSASANPRAGIGSRLQSGDLIRSSPDAAFQLPTWSAGRRVAWTEIPDFGRSPTVRLWPGPQWTAFSESQRHKFLGTAWTVSSQSDRVGYRLDGAPLTHDLGELISQPVLPGTVQIPPHGQPIITMPDGPTLGGYPQLGWVDSRDLGRLAQCRPGVPIQWKLTTSA